MNNSLTPIAQRFPDEFDPGVATGGESYLLDTIVGPVWNCLMSKGGNDDFGAVRVVSAWRAFKENTYADDGVGYDDWHEVARDDVAADIGKELADSKYWQCFGPYRVFARLFQAFGSDWPIKALETRMIRIHGASKEEAEDAAVEIWGRALAIYDAHKAAIKLAA